MNFSASDEPSRYFPYGKYKGKYIAVASGVHGWAVYQQVTLSIPSTVLGL